MPIAELKAATVVARRGKEQRLLEKLGKMGLVSDDSHGSSVRDKIYETSRISEEDQMSTDGDESEPESPVVSDTQYLNNSKELRQALQDSKALVGDYVELKNCKRCGAMMFRN